MLIRHSLLYVVSKLVPGVLGMGTTAILTRLLPPGVYGVYGLALVVMTFGSTMVFDWLGLSFLRVYQARRGDPVVISTVVHIFAGLVGATAVLAVIAWAAGLFAEAGAGPYAIGIVMMWSYAWFELVSRFEVAEFRPTKYLVMNLGRAAFVLVGTATAAWLTGSPVWAAGGTAAGTLAGAMLGGFAGWRFGPGTFDRALARGVLTFGLPLAASLALSAVITSGTRALVGWVGSTEELGLFTAAFMLVQNTLAVAAAGIASAAYSLAVRAVESGDPVAARRQLLDNGTLLLAVLAPAALGMALTSHGVAVTLVGARYVAAVERLTPWMAAGAFFGSIRAHFLDHAFQLGKRPNLQVGVTAVAAVIAFGLSLILIPRPGYFGGSLGAAVGVTVALAVSCVHAALAGRHAYRLPLPWNAAARIALACLVMAVCVLLVPVGGTPGFLLQVAAGGVGYVVAAVALDVLGSRRMAVRAVSSLAGKRLRKAAITRPD